MNNELLKHEINDFLVEAEEMDYTELPKLLILLKKTYFDSEDIVQGLKKLFGGGF